MFDYPKSYQDAKDQLHEMISFISNKGYQTSIHKEYISDIYYIEKVTIKAKSRMQNRIVLSSGIHGIEGYIGHVCQMYFIKQFLDDVHENTEVILYHIINPYGMIHNRRFNHNNIDLNRNYSNTGFSLKNPDFIKVQSLLMPRISRSKFSYNLWFYKTVIFNIMKYGLQAMNNAVLKGQKVEEQSIYYSGSQYEKSTKYILSELEHIYRYVDGVVWFDIHSGYGKKYGMSVINSRYETTITKELKQAISYNNIIGYELDSMYDTDGDITEKLYHVHKELDAKSDLLALCLEFGTIGSGLVNELKSFKSILLENNIYHLPHSKRLIKYKDKLMKQLFINDSIKWKNRQIKNFDHAVGEILAYKKLIK